MKKNMKAILSLFLVLVFTLQIPGMLAVAEPETEITGEEALIYELYLPNPDPEAEESEKLIPVTADKEAELLSGKTISIVLEHEKPLADDAEDENEDNKVRVALTRVAGAAVLKDLLTEDLVITPPDGYYVSQLYLRGDAIETQEIKALPFTADAEKNVLTLKAGAISAIDKETEKEIIDPEFITTSSTVDPPICALVVVLSPVDEEKPVTVTEKLSSGDNEVQVERGESYTAADAPADTAEHKFSAWKVVYESGASLLLKPGESFKPYADCTVEPIWTEILVITAKTPVPSGDSCVTDGYTYTGKLSEGDEIAEVSLALSETDGSVVSVPSQAVIRHNGKDVSDSYELQYVPSDPYILPVEEPQPEPAVEITITANAPVFNAGEAAANGYELTIGSLNEGDSIESVELSVQMNDDGSFVAVPANAVIKNGEADNTSHYNIHYQKSASVLPPEPEKVNITITANPPILEDGSYVKNGYTISEGSLTDGDDIVSLEISVEKNEDGSYVAVPSNAVIKNGETDNTGMYVINYAPSAKVTPEEKIALTLRSKDRTAEYDGKQITADSYEIVSGALAEGDTIEVTYDGGSINVTESPVVSGIASVVIKDSAGNDVTNSKYAVTLDNNNAGKVTVTKRLLTITAISGTVETDGTKTIVASECKTSSGSFTNGYSATGLLSGHSLKGNFVLGSSNETFVTSIDKNAVKVVDANGNDVTGNYEIKTVDGKLTIKVTVKTNVPVAVISKDQTLTYDGTAHKPDPSTCTISGLLDGDVATVTLQLVQGSSTLSEATKAGTYTIVPVVTIKTKDGAAVSPDKYKITTTNATLTINPFEVTLEAVSASKVYDGTALRNGEVRASKLVSGHNFRSGDGVKFTVTDTDGNLVANGVTKVGVYTKSITEVHIVDASGVEVTENYKIIKIDGKLEVTQSAQSQAGGGNASKADGSKPGSGGVKTGDTSNDTLYIIVFVAAALLIASIVAYLIMQSRKKPVAKAGPSLGEEYFEPDETTEAWAKEEDAPVISKNDAWLRSDNGEDWTK